MEIMYDTGLNKNPECELDAAQLRLIQDNSGKTFIEIVEEFRSYRTGQNSSWKAMIYLKKEDLEDLVKNIERILPYVP